MRRLAFISIATMTILLIAFDAKKCDHVFTSVVEPEVQAVKQEGQDIICVKCFHRQKQVVDYSMK